jgi:PAS domain S-box-containing protein
MGMQQKRKSAGAGIAGTFVSGARGVALLVILLLAGRLPAAEEGAGPEELRTAAQVRRMTAEQAARQVPVHLRGVVTHFDESLFSRFVQDQTAGIYLRSTNLPPLTAGQLIEVEGVTDPGEYAPVVVPTQVKVVGEAPLPAAKPVSIEQLVSGQEDSQFVEVMGKVRAVRFEPESQYYLIDLVTEGERFTAYLKELPVPGTEALIDSTVKVRGVCSTLFNRQRQLFGFRLLVPRATDLVIEKPAPGNPFAIPTQPIDSLLRFTPLGAHGPRVKVVGTVIYQEPGAALFVQDDTEGLYAQTQERTPVQIGDRVEILGFTAKGDYTPMLQDAIYRKVEAGKVPEPDAVDLDEILKGTHDCRLVRLEANILDRTQRGREQILVLETRGFVFQCYLGQGEDGSGFARMRNGSKVAVTGICLIERGSSWRAGEVWRAKSFRLLLRSPADVVVLQSPPWWTLKKLLWIVGILGVVALAAFAWVGVLRRRVRKQTEIIRQQLQVEATLKERYVDLFENANDMVFTHDLNGRITSVNQTGTRLLQKPREKILSQSFVDLMAEDQRPAARQWLDQVVKGADLPAAEWDFLNAAGHRVKLEISSRLVQQDGRVVEVEGIARDITERRRLEREILEISTREQRRIGHDLHDGVCQQLAAITYLLDILGDRLKERDDPESAEAERIGLLINEANVQARSVAQGLFPARLEEHGLVLALEELAANASNRFHIACRFTCQAAPAPVDEEVALHLYYIVQEALLNAVNHGQATSVLMTLEAEGDRLKLSVQDNGSGFDAARKDRSGMGIRIMRYRAKVVGATLDLESRINQGTLITCIFNPSQRESSRKTTDGRSNP